MLDPVTLDVIEATMAEPPKKWWNWYNLSFSGKIRCQYTGVTITTPYKGPIGKPHDTEEQANKEGLMTITNYVGDSTYLKRTARYLGAVESE